jgi:hypothetical protein
VRIVLAPILVVWFSALVVLGTLAGITDAAATLERSSVPRVVRYSALIILGTLAGITDAVTNTGAVKCPQNVLPRSN